MTVANFDPGRALARLDRGERTCRDRDVRQAELLRGGEGDSVLSGAHCLQSRLAHQRHGGQMENGVYRYSLDCKGSVKGVRAEAADYN